MADHILWSNEECCLIREYAGPTVRFASLFHIAYQLFEKKIKRSLKTFLKKRFFFHNFFSPDNDLMSKVVEKNKKSNNLEVIFLFILSKTEDGGKYLFADDTSNSF